jgi:hypothetical protein
MKLVSLEEEKAQLDKDLAAAATEAMQLAIRQQLVANQQAQTALLSALVAPEFPESDARSRAPDFENRDPRVTRLIAIFGQQKPLSDKVTTTSGRGASPENMALAASLKRRSRFSTCAVCGFRFDSKQNTVVAELNDRYPGQTSRGKGVAIAHIIPTEAECNHVGVPWDESNFIPLCGNMDERPSCHHAFDHRFLSIIHTNGAWTAKTSHADYLQLNDRVVRLPPPTAPGAPHRTVLHARAYSAFVNQQLLPADPFDALDDTPPKTELEELARGLHQQGPANPDS